MAVSARAMHAGCGYAIENMHGVALRNQPGNNDAAYPAGPASNQHGEILAWHRQLRRAALGGHLLW